MTTRMPSPSPAPTSGSTGGPWPFTREPVITGPVPKALYELYREAFEPLKVRAAARQVLTRERVPRLNWRTTGSTSTLRGRTATRSASSR